MGDVKRGGRAGGYDRCRREPPLTRRSAWDADRLVTVTLGDAW